MRSCRVLVTALSLLLTAMVGAEPDFKIAVTVGVGEWMKDGRASVVQVTISNDGKSGGEYDLLVGASAPSGTARASRLRLALPPHSRKAVEIPFAGQVGADGVVVTILDRSRILASHTVAAQVAGGSDTLIAFVGFPPDALPSLEAIEDMAGRVDDLTRQRVFSKAGSMAHIARLGSIAQLPDSSIGWESFSVLALRGSESRDWTTARIKRLHEWLTSGGLLVLCPDGSDRIFRAGPLAKLAPLTSERDLSPIDVAPLIRVTAAMNLPAMVGFRAQLTEGGRCLLGEQQPLIAVRAIGRGQVMALAFDPCIEPFASWSGQTELWCTLLRLYAGRHARVSTDNAVRAYLERVLKLAGVARPLPRAALLAPILLYGLALIVAAFVIARTERRQLAWFIYCGLALTFGVTYFVAFRATVRGRPFIGSVARTVARLDGPGAMTRVDSIIFSPRSEQLNVTVNAADALCERPLDWQTLWRRSLTAEDRFDCASTTLSGYPARGWNYDLLMARLPTPSPVRLRAERVVDAGGSRAVRLINEDDYPLRRVRFVLSGGDQYPVPDIVAHGSVQVPADVAALPIAAQSWQSRGASVALSQAEAEKELLDEIKAPWQYAHRGAETPLTLYAISERPPAHATIPGFKRATLHVVAVSMPPGLFIVPETGTTRSSGEAREQLQASLLGRHAAKVETEWDSVRIGRGDAQFDFPLLARAASAVTALRVSGKYDLTGTGATARFQFFDWSKGRWLSVRSGATSFNESLGREFYHPQLRLARMRVVVSGRGADAQLNLSSVTIRLQSAERGER